MRSLAKQLEPVVHVVKPRQSSMNAVSVALLAVCYDSSIGDGPVDV